MTSDVPPSLVWSEAHDGVAVVRFRGDLDSFGGNDMRKCCLSLLDDGTPSVVLDLSQTTYFDSRGLTDLLVVHHHSGGSAGQRVRLVVNGLVRRRLVATGTAALWPLHETLGDAVSAASGA
ncbi:STAS domain-containing protein [Umezawaea tangerina]|uniref:Anti-sigma B factor antagonist n=1 Tax=Umezawaea tangerina TaxID=84725 RepID=A0A2T0STI0_9PSEU|nr:STAS domain-containing protein [Umezawaea tangerina]PRY36727.1 anti-sigma B factor antagonist [Umezawaea tangerina]